MVRESARLKMLREQMYIHYDSQDFSQDPAHGKEHISNVYEIGMKIGEEEGANLDVLGASILLHDSIRPSDEKGESKHAYQSAEFAQRILPSFGYMKSEINYIKEAIITSSRSGGSGVIPHTLEAKITFDADKIDGGGEIGIKRTQAYRKAKAEKENKPYSEEAAMTWYLGRITDVLKIGLFTETARKMMDERLKTSFKYIKKTIGEDNFVNIMRNDLGDKADTYLSISLD